MDEQDCPHLPPGTDVGGVVIEERVKAGGYGTVFRARDPGTGKLLALKFISLRRAEAWAHRESLITLSLHHDNLVRQVGCGYWPPDAPRFMWLKMLFVEGPELDVWARLHNPDAWGVVGKMLGVTRGLTVAHAQHVVHRDIKEANILVGEHGAGEPVLVDFGAARREGQGTITRGLFPPGTPRYRSPEAWRFSMERGHEPLARYRPGPADDLYALGVVLYGLLTDRPPFDVEPDEPASMLAVIHRAPVPPHIVNPRVPEALSRVCMRLLEKTPEARYPSAMALYEVLEGLLATADASWRVPLRLGPRRGGRRGSPLGKELAPVRGMSGPFPGAVWPLRAVALLAMRHTMVGMGVVLGLVLVGGWLSSHLSARSLLTTSSSSVPTHEPRFGQEVAPSRPPPDSARAATPPWAEASPATAASPATHPQDDAMMPPPTPRPSGKKKPSRSTVPGWCVGAAAAAQAACSGHQVRAESTAKPVSLPCPPGAAESHARLQLLSRPIGSVSHLGVGEQPRWITVPEGATSVRLSNPWGALPHSSRLYGVISIGPDRVYGRFTEARTPTGASFPVCLDIWRDDLLGSVVKPGEGSEPTQVFSLLDVRVVETIP